MKATNEIIKHSAAIQTSGASTLNARKTFNVLLANAFNSLLNQEEHEIQVKDLLDDLKATNTKNTSWLIKTCEELMGVIIRWNILNQKGKHEIGASSLLASAHIVDGVLTYAYSPAIKRLLNNPDFYARINLAVQNKFKCKHSLILYELCLDWLGGKQSSASSGIILLEQVRELFGVSRNYPQFHELNRSVMQPALKEVNAPKNNSRIKVKMLKVKSGRKVIGIKFLIETAAKTRKKKESIDMPVKPTYESLQRKQDRKNKEQQEVVKSHTQSVFNNLTPKKQEEWWLKFESEQQALLFTPTLCKDGKLDRTHHAVEKSFWNWLGKHKEI